MKPVDEVQTADEARELAIEWQGLDQPMSWDELYTAQDYFGRLAEKFPELMEEFRENGIV